MNLFRRSIILSLILCCSSGVWAEVPPEEQFPINDDVDIYLPENENEVVVKSRAQTEINPVESQVKEEVSRVLQELYKAYQDKDVAKVLKMMRPFFENNAAEYASRHKDNDHAFADVIWAYESFIKDVIEHKDYHLDPFTLEFSTFNQLKDGRVEVSSPVPIIGTKPLDFVEENEETIHYITTSLRLGRFILLKEDKNWQIVEVDLF